MSARAGIVVTGTEVLSGRVADRNGPWLSDRLGELGVDHAYTVVVGDRAEDMDRALASGRPPTTSPRRSSAASRAGR
jgi:molybdopterin-biosynthesis enzyme MoeA-like protein